MDFTKLKSDRDNTGIVDTWNIMNDEKTFNPFPHTDAFISLPSRRRMKPLWQKENSIMMMFSTLFNYYTFICKVFIVLPKCFRIRLLQMCCMWERVKENEQLLTVKKLCISHNVFKHRLLHMGQKSSASRNCLRM